MPTTETKHLTSLAFDLTQLQAQLTSIPASVEQAAKAAQDAWNNNFSAGGGTGSGAGDSSGAEMSATQSKLESLMLSYKNFQATLANSKLEPAELLRLRAVIDTSIESIEGLTGSLAKNGKLAKEESAEYRELISTLKELKGAYADVKTDVGDAQKGTQGETIITATKSQLESLILQYKNFEATLSRTKIYPESIGTLKKATEEATADLVALTGKLDANGNLTGESALKYQDFTSKLKGAKGEFADLSKKANEAAGATNNVGASADKAGGLVSNFLGKLADKARWLAAFYLIQSIINGFKSLISTVKETESTVVELQRVLNEDISSPEISSQLYDIAYEYGRTFEEVQESAVLFAQTGKSWNDVLTLTRGTMLALNTAELEVTSATQGLIAVMAQWNLGAEDYVELIDKINITADNFAITSEKIVAALQRSGSTAKAYGMTLEELIGVITALGEATGRSGENIGTAINSLITYTTKAKSIDVLEKMGIDAEDAEGNLRPVLEIWSQLAQKIKGGDLAFADFMASDQDAMDSFLSDSEEYQQAVADTIASGKEVQDAYSIAGTYRKNYFIALLNNLGTAEEAVRGMTDAEGYSVTENEKYMATLEALSNQLTASWKQLAVAFGDAGFLEFLKFLTKLGTGIADIIGDTGGLKVSLFAILGIMLMIKAQRIQEMFTGWAVAIKNVVTGFKTATTAAQVFQTAVGWIGLIMTAISLLVAAIKGVNSSLEANREKLLEAGEAARQNTESLNDLINKYEELANSSDFELGNESALASAKSIHEDIVELLGDQASGWDLVSGKVDENVAKLREAQLQNIKNQRADLESANNIAQKQLETFKQFTMAEYNAIQSAFSKTGEKNTGWLGANAELQMAFIKDGAQGAVDLLKSWQTEFNALGKDGADAVSAVTAMIDVYTEKIDAAARARKNWLENEAMGEVLEKSKSITIDSADAYDAYVKSVDDAADAEKITAEYAIYLKEAIADLYPEFSGAIKPIVAYDEELKEGAQSLALYATELENIRTLISDVTKEMDDAQSAYKALQSIVDEYNETGVMSVDMLQQLMELEPEYIALLDVTASGISINKDATDALIDSKMRLIDANLALKEAEYASGIAAEFNAYATDEAYDAANNVASGSASAAAGLQSLISSAYTAGMSAEDVAQRLYELGYVQSAVGSKAIAMANQVLTASQAMNTLRSAASSTFGTLASFAGISPAAASSSSGGGGGGGGGEDPQIKILEERKKAIEETAKAQIDALKKVQEAEDRKRRRDEYLADKSEALADVRRAQARSGIDAREDEANAEKKLAETNKDWQEQLQDWNLDDQIASIEEWKDAMVDAIDAQIDALKNAGGGGGGGGVETFIADEATVLQDNLNSLLAVLLQMDNENLPDKIKQFYEMFNASQYTDDVDFADKLAGIKTEWDSFADDNGDDWAIHYRMVLDDGTTLSPEQITEYINGLLDGATSESDVLERDKEGLGILLRINPEFSEDDEASKTLEQQWSDTVNALGKSLDEMLALWEFNNLDMTSAQKAIEDAFGASFEVVQQGAAVTGGNVETELTTAMDNSGAGMLASVNLYAPQIADAWKNGAINPMIASLAGLSTALDDVLLQLGQVASFGGLSGIYGVGSTNNTTNQSQVNLITLRGHGKGQTDSLSKWFMG